MMRATAIPTEPISCVRHCVSLLLEADVIDNTFGVMNALLRATQTLAARSTTLSSAEKIELKCLERLSSESIREALHKHELSITNGIIRNKNILLRAIGIVPDEFHQEIDPKNYAWNW